MAPHGKNAALVKWGAGMVSSVWVIGSIAQITHPAGVAHIERH